MALTPNKLIEPTGVVVGLKQEMASAPYGIADINSNFTAGLISGGLMTVNAGDSAKFDVSAGTGLVMDYTVPTAPTPVFLTWNAFIGESLPNILLGTTIVSIDKTGSLVKVSGAFEPESAKRTSILLQTISHASTVQIDAIDDFTSPAIDYAKGLMDIIDQLPPFNSDNQFTAGGTDLTLDKSSGLTIKPFINYRSDILNPSTITDASITGVSFIRSYQDGVGGFTLDAFFTDLDPDKYDDGSGTLATLAPNKFQTKLICYFAQGPNIVISYGQTVYNSMAEAILDIPYQTLNLNPLLRIATCPTVVVIKEGTTDLTNSSDALLLHNRHNFLN